MRIFSMFWMIVFGLFALVQYNDPDPWLWIPIYMASVYTSYLAFKGQFPVFVLSAMVIVYIAGAVFYFPGSISTWIHAEEQAKSLEMQMPFIEEAREAMGLLICAFVNTFYAYFGARKLKSST